MHKPLKSGKKKFSLNTGNRMQFYFKMLIKRNIGVTCSSKSSYIDKKKLISSKHTLHTPRTQPCDARWGAPSHTTFLLSGISQGVNRTRKQIQVFASATVGAVPEALSVSQDWSNIYVPLSPLFFPTSHHENKQACTAIVV